MSMTFNNLMPLAVMLTDVVVIALLFYRRLWRTLPVFCCYILWDFLSDIFVYAIVLYYPRKYFDIYFIQIAIDSALLFCVMVELGWSVLRPVRASLSRRALFVVAFLILAAGAILWPIAGLPGLAHAAPKQWLLMTQLQQTVSILRIFLFLVLAAGSQLLSIGWRDRELQVAAGLGFYSLVSVAVSFLHEHQSTHGQYTRLERVASVAGLCSLLYWAFCFAQKEAERRAFTPEMQRVLLSVAGAAHATRVALTEPQTSNTRK